MRPLVTSIFLYACDIMDPHSRAPKKNTSHGNEVLAQDTMHLIQRPCFQRGRPCQDPAGNQASRRPPDDRKEMQTAVVSTCLPFIGSGRNHLASRSEKGKKTRQTEEEVGRQHQGIDRPGVRQVPEGSGEQGKWRKLVAKSSVVPQRPSRLRDRWEMKCKYRHVLIIDCSDLVVFAIGPYCSLNCESDFSLWYDELCSTLILKKIYLFVFCF